MADFYAETVQRLVKEGHLTRKMRILVLCGGTLDRNVFAGCGFTDVTISNLDERMVGDEFAPFAWSFQDAENISYADGEFDFCFVHNGLHHCYSPHRALLEMYRVARIGLVVFEPRDGLITRLGVALSMGQEYETAAVFDNNCDYGGVKNSEIPNFVYRWTEDEVRKCISSFAPTGRHRFGFFYATRIPWRSLRLKRNKMYLFAAVMLLPILKAMSVVTPRICNNFGFMVLKPKLPADLFPWIELAGGKERVKRSWLVSRYR